MKEKLRKMLLEMLNRQFNHDSGISTRTNLYMVEVQLLKDLLQVYTGAEQEDLHDIPCDFIDLVHKKYDC